MSNTWINYISLYDIPWDDGEIAKPNFDSSISIAQISGRVIEPDPFNHLPNRLIRFADNLTDLDLNGS